MNTAEDFVFDGEVVDLTGRRIIEDALINDDLDGELIGATATHATRIGDQDADVLLGKLEQAGTLVHAVRDHRHAWLQLFAGSLSVDGQTLEAGDAAAISDQPAVEIQSREPAEFLLFDLV